MMKHETTIYKSYKYHPREIWDKRYLRSANRNFLKKIYETRRITVRQKTNSKNKDFVTILI